MKREIIFRGKRLDSGEWVEGSYFKILDSECFLKEKEVLKHHIVNEFGKFEVVNHETVGQYTGMNDKNGSRIFEGDVLRQDGCSDFYIVFNERTSSLGWSFTDPIRAQGYIHQMTKYDMGRGEVCGNVHDNPELLVAE